MRSPLVRGSQYAIKASFFSQMELVSLPEGTLEWKQKTGETNFIFLKLIQQQLVQRDAYVPRISFTHALPDKIGGEWEKVDLVVEGALTCLYYGRYTEREKWGAFQVMHKHSEEGFVIRYETIIRDRFVTEVDTIEQVVPAIEEAIRKKRLRDLV